MPKTSRSYSAWQLEQLSDPERARRYLNAAREDSLELFLVALGKVAQARQMSYENVLDEMGLLIVIRTTAESSLSAAAEPGIALHKG